MNKVDAVKLIEQKIKMLDLSLDKTIITHEKDFRLWVNNNLQLLGITKVLEIRGITRDNPDFKILVNDVELEIDMVIKSSRFTNSFHNKTNVDLCLCCIRDTIVTTTDIPIFVVLLKVNDVAKQRRNDKKAAGTNLEKVYVSKDTKTRLAKWSFLGSSNIIISTLLDAYESNSKKKEFVDTNNVGYTEN